jgi:hypothetical protein
MHRLVPLLRLIAAAALSTAALAQAGTIFMNQDIDANFRAKIMKEKAKINSQKADNFNFNQPANAPGSPQCGSQNIGNVDTNGRIGAAPREVFVFAPNAINLVSANGCN